MLTLLVVILSVMNSGLGAQSANVSGDWEMTRQPDFGMPQYGVLRLEANGDRVTISVSGVKGEGTLRGGALDTTLVTPGDNPQRGRLLGTLQNGEWSGTGSVGESSFTWTARRPLSPPAGGPRTHRFVPTTFHNFFAWNIAPALHLFPGETVETTTVDAGGRDQTGVRRSAGGNPLTGPFYVEGAMPGDTIVVKLNRVRLNRDTAGSGDQIVPTALTPNYHRNLKFDDKFDSGWTLDRAAGVARLAKPTDRLKNYTVPLRPMLGCIGVAPPAQMSFRSGYLGAWGGNLDYNELVEGATVYLPVYYPGALLFIGDGHAVEGDGELTGDALETSMDVSFTVDVIHGRSVPMPRAENATYRMASGVDNSLDRALQQATTNLARWLAEDYQLTANEVAVVLGSAIRYDVAEVVDPYVHVVAKIDKSLLARIQK